MENKIINIKMVVRVAEALEELKDKMVFVGGAVISLYTDDPAADEIRPTSDIDMAIELAGFGEWVKLNERLLSLGFSPNPEGNAICNYLYKGIEVDIMPAENSAIGTSNRWYKPGFSLLQKTEVEDQNIQILPVTYFLATKLEAFNDRGKDYRTSHDFEDVIYVIDNRSTIVNDILDADNEVRGFIIDMLKKVSMHKSFEEIISSQIHPLMVNDRLPIVIEKIKKITA